MGLGRGLVREFVGGLILELARLLGRGFVKGHFLGSCEGFIRGLSGAIFWD